MDAGEQKCKGQARGLCLAALFVCVCVFFFHLPILLTAGSSSKCANTSANFN